MCSVINGLSWQWKIHLLSNKLNWSEWDAQPVQHHSICQQMASFLYLTFKIKPVCQYKEHQTQKIWVAHHVHLVPTVLAMISLPNPTFGVQTQIMWYLCISVLQTIAALKTAQVMINVLVTELESCVEAVKKTIHFPCFLQNALMQKHAKTTGCNPWLSVLLWCTWHGTHPKSFLELQDLFERSYGKRAQPHQKTVTCTMLMKATLALSLNSSKSRQWWNFPSQLNERVKQTISSVKLNPTWK